MKFKLFKANRDVPLLLIVGSIAGLLYAYCSPTNVANDPNWNGGYRVGGVYRLKVAVFAEENEIIPPNWSVSPMGTRTPIAMGTKIKVTRIYKHNQFVMDNAFLTLAEGEWIDGPNAGKPVSLYNISKRGPHREATLDPDILDPE